MSHGVAGGQGGIVPLPFLVPQVDADGNEIRAAAADLIKERYLLGEDLGNVVARANAHWDYATRPLRTDNR